MKALCLQLSIAVCAIFSISNLSAQSLEITCPNPDFRPLICIEDLPAQAGDSLGFLSLDGALIEGVTGNLNIRYTDFTRDGNGCPGQGNAIEVIRSFNFSDDAQTEEIMCNVRYIIAQVEGVDMIECADITVSLDATGNVTIDESDLQVTPTLQCPGDITLTNIGTSSYSCNDVVAPELFNSATVVTECGEVLDCSFEVTIEDNENPVITCPENILVEADACVCEAPVVFEDASATDACSFVITRIDTFIQLSGDIFPTGITLLTFQAEDLSGNTSSCNLQIRVNSSDPGSLICKGAQNISLDQNCEGLISPSMVVDEPNCDIDSYTITLYDQQGNLLPSDTITSEYLGTIVTARATYECYDNYCEASFNVEDKMPPMMNCSDMTISCSELLEFPLPQISDNCSTFEVVLLNQKLEDVACDSATIDKIITRTYGIENEEGDIMESCDQRLFISKFDIATVVGPELTVMVDCGSGFAIDENGNPDPSVTGAPSLDGIDLYPQSDILCNVSLTYDDMVLNGGSTCGRTLLRTWTVVNWYCGSDGMVTFKQSIAVVDTTNPVLVLPLDTVISSGSLSCETPYTIPQPGMSDNCQSDLQLDIFHPGGVEFDTNSIQVELDLGENLISYRLSDRCGNMVMQSYTVTVEDNIEPVAICKSGMSFSLDGNGLAILTAQNFDNGSLDACTNTTLEIARMTDGCGIESDLEFGPSVTLCCADIGTDLMISLQVTDDMGNSNSCMTSIQVEDQLKPSFLTTLPDITVSNDFPFDTSDLIPFGFVEQNVDFPMEINIVADSIAFSGANLNAIVMDNCSVNTISESVTADISMCRTGLITRMFVVSDEFGVADTIFQRITIISENVFSLSDITFPNDTILSNECPVDISPLTLGSFPIYDDIYSSMVAHVNEDDTIQYSSPGCFTIDRVWFVSDWCNRPDGLTFATYRDTQRITIVDNMEPEVLTGCIDSTIISFISGCGPHPVNISASGTDNCTVEDSLQWSFVIEFADGSPDSIGTGFNFTGFLPIGDNRITWILDDACGNTDDCSSLFTIESGLNPQPLCIVGEDFYLSPIDTSDNGIDDPVNIVVITPDLLDAGSMHPCGLDITVSFSEDVTDTVRIYDCDSGNNQALMLYATDTNGNFDFCNLSFNVRDTAADPLCGMGLVAGVVFGNEVDFVKDVNVILEGSGLQTMTDANGFFEFPEMPSGGEYQVLASKSDVALNGVSTSDLVMIQRHILGIQEFESPYKRLAADVNASSHISAADIITMRKLLLGLISEFPGGETWSFIPGDFVFLDPSNPWSSSIPETHNIYFLNGHQELDFIGVKLGDVNESVQLRSTETLTYKIEGNKLNVMVSQNISFAALLAEISMEGLEGLELIEIENHSSSLVENHHMNQEGVLKLLLTDARDENFSAGDPLFSLVFDRIIGEDIVAGIELLSEKSEMVFETGATSKVEFRGIGDKNGIKLGQNIPNPWVDQTVFEVTIAVAGNVQIRIMDLAGKVVYRENRMLEEGRNVVKLRNESLPAAGGMYIYEVNSSIGIASKKMMLIRN